MSRAATCVPLLLAVVRAGAAPLSANKKPPLHPVNLNTAAAWELQQCRASLQQRLTNSEEAQIVRTVQERG